MMKRLLLVFLGILLPSLASAAASDYRKFFRVDLEQPLPMLAELKQKYQTEDIYDKHYDYSWNIGNRFDQAFRDIIKSYGTSEKRLKPEYEDRLLEMLAIISVLICTLFPACRRKFSISPVLRKPKTNSPNGLTRVSETSQDWNSFRRRCILP